MLQHLSAFLIWKKYQTHQQIIVHMVRKASKPSSSTVVESFQQSLYSWCCACHATFHLLSSANGVENVSKIHNKSAEGDMNEQLKELSTSSMLETVSKLEYPCEDMSDPSSRSCFSGALLLANENDKNQIEELPRRSQSFSSHYEILFNVNLYFVVLTVVVLPISV